MATQRTHVLILRELVLEIDRVAGKRRRSEFLIAAAERELVRQRQIEALDAAVGAWKDEDHPELRHGVAAWVRELRKDRPSLAD